MGMCHLTSQYINSWANPGCLLHRAQLGAIAGIINLCVQGQGGDIVMRILRYALRKAVLSSAQADQQQGMFFVRLLVYIGGVAAAYHLVH